VITEGADFLQQPLPQSGCLDLAWIEWDRPHFAPGTHPVSMSAVLNERGRLSIKNRFRLWQSQASQPEANFSAAAISIPSGDLFLCLT